MFSHLNNLLPCRSWKGTVATVCREMDALHRLTNGIALLDVLQSFATVVSCSLHHSCESQLSLQLHHVIQAPERCSGALSLQACMDDTAPCVSEVNPPAQCLTSDWPMQVNTAPGSYVRAKR